jgi:hypothetical protein
MVPGQDAELTTQVLFQSRTTANVLVRLSQAGVARCSFIVLLGNLARMKGISVFENRPPVLPALHDCLDAGTIIQKNFGGMFKVADEVSIRVPRGDPFCTTTLAGKSHPTAVCSISGYMAFKEGRAPCLSFFCDAAPPPTLNAMLTTWVPTLDYGVQFFANPLTSSSSSKGVVANAASDSADGAPKPQEWVRFQFRSGVVRDGLVSTDGELWSNDEEPRILARSRQLARHLAPPSR